MSYFEYNDVYAGYSKEMNVLQGINFSLERDSRVALIGANGAGKSTIMKTISGLVPLQKGSIVFDGERLDGLSPHKIVERGVIQVPEEGGTFPNLTIEENLMISCVSKKAKENASKNLSLVYDMLEPLAIKSALLAGSLSGGQRKMLSIGKAIMEEPALLLLDDISMGLAPKVVQELYGSLKRLVDRLNKPVLVVEQIMEIALQFADYGHVVQQGRIVMSGTSKELLNSEKVKSSYIGG